MKLSLIAFLGLLVLASAGCSLSENQGQDPKACQTGEAAKCLGTPGSSSEGPGHGGSGIGGHGMGGGMGGGM
jgi:hypothetical protein